MEGIKSRPPPNIKQPDWDKHIDFWFDAKIATRALQNAQNWAKSKVFFRQGSQSLAVIRDMQEEMLRLRNLGANTPTGVPYTEDQIMAMVRRGKQQGRIPGVGGVLVGDKDRGNSTLSIDPRARKPPIRCR
ncbi:hypothetical protein Tco_0728618 [Tanacetum coccineum]|uniref:Uncharacterized protein n=1 Tax=Tanacetum coccineum TaxID=301880 RepID=A0ABQ4YMH2_9ASTR